MGEDFRDLDGVRKGLWLGGGNVEEKRVEG